MAIKLSCPRELDEGTMHHDCWSNYRNDHVFHFEKPSLLSHVIWNERMVVVPKQGTWWISCDISESNRASIWLFNGKFSPMIPSLDKHIDGDDETWAYSIEWQGYDENFLWEEYWNACYDHIEDFFTLGRIEDGKLTWVGDGRLGQHNNHLSIRDITW